ncbi:redoxin domain-containing protein [Paenibacillus sp. GCM10027626]|uniref:redoxin domain-containing protein n=1 Tax=Paenibacillus sp. GCM10027626 TaxID=3273411 RepID=UPI00363BC7E4
MNVAMRRWLGGILLIVLLAAGIYVFMQPGKDIKEPVRIGAIAPDFKATDLAGNTVSLSDYRGKGVLLNFWGSWCAPCVKEMPRIEHAYRSAIPGVEVLGVNVGQSRGTVKEFAEENGIEFPLLLDPGGKAAEAYWIKGLPATFLIDAEQKIVDIVPGEIASDAQAKELLELVRPGKN